MRQLTVATLLAVTAFAFAGSSQSRATSGTAIAERPLIIGVDQGEARIRRFRPGQNPGMARTPFTFKIDQRNGGSPDFWFATETLALGAEIKYHRHLHEDEMLYIGSGTAHVHVGNIEGDAQAGGMIFIPRNTWVDVKNVGATPIHLLFGFNRPGFDRYLRCASVPKGQPAPPLSIADWKRCQLLGDVQYR